MVGAGTGGGDDLAVPPGPVQPVGDALGPGFQRRVMAAGGDEEEPSWRDERSGQASHAIIGAQTDGGVLAGAGEGRRIADHDIETLVCLSQCRHDLKRITALRADSCAEPVVLRRLLRQRQGRRAGIDHQRRTGAGQCRPQTEGAGVAEDVEHRRAGSERGNAVAVRPLIEEPAGLLSRQRVDRDAQPPFPHLSPRIGPVQQQHFFGQTFKPAGGSIVAGNDGPRCEQLLQDLDDQRYQPVHAGGVHLQDEHIVIPVDYQTGQAISLGMHQAMKAAVAHAGTQRAGIGETAANPIGVNLRIRVSVEQARRDQAVGVEHGDAEPGPVLLLDVHQGARGQAPCIDIHDDLVAEYPGRTSPQATALSGTKADRRPIHARTAVKSASQGAVGHLLGTERFVAGQALSSISIMLEHFARITARVTGMAAAAVGLRRPGESRIAFAGYGPLESETEACLEMDQFLRGGPLVTAISDLEQDVRLAGGELARRCGLRSLLHMKLMSPGGDCIGFVCAADTASRDTFTDADFTPMSEIAHMLLADRQRGLRHHHMIQVANRALRVDRLLRLVADSSTAVEALADVLEEVCRFYGASAGRIWQWMRAGDSLREVGFYDADLPDEPTAVTTQRVVFNPPIVRAIRRHEPHSTRFIPPGPATSREVPITPAIRGQVCVPIGVQQQRFAIVVAFAGERPDLELVMADISALADSIRPALFRKVSEDKIRFVAHHDNLTQLANRLMFHERLERLMISARANERSFALLCLDLDDFKAVNDASGHDAGDELLVAVAERLRENVREGDIVARMGGDEFAIIQPAATQPAAAVALAQRVLATLSQPFDLAGGGAVVGASIGIAICPQHGDNPETLMRNADVALYRAKRAGRRTYRLFGSGMESDPRERTSLEQDLRAAIEARHFMLHYQPICDIDTLRVTGFEALLRWYHPHRGEIPPDRFIPLAETTGLIVPLGLWALEAACTEAASWPAPIRLSVNLSPLQFRQPELPDQIAAVLARTGFPGRRLDLEITEGVLLDEGEVVLKTIESLRRQGIGITLDDFGTAYASLSYLRRFRFDRIKVDRSFTACLTEDDSAVAIVEAILSLADKLRLVVVAEGVETEAQLAILRRLGCRDIQGFLSGRPMPGPEARRVVGADMQAVV